MSENIVSLQVKELEFGVDEAIKSLRTNLLYSGDIKAIAVTSATAGEGKSTVAFELARSFADLGKRTVLIDCDLRKSMLANRYGISESMQGLSELLSGQARKVIYETNIDNLYLVLSGKNVPNPQELLAGERFITFVDALKKSCDYIIFDTPPLGGMADALIVGKQTDGTLIVIRNDYVKKAMVRSVKRQIQQSGGKILGVVLNRVKKNQKDYYYKKNYGYYDK